MGRAGDGKIHFKQLILSYLFPAKEEGISRNLAMQLLQHSTRRKEISYDTPEAEMATHRR
jgi:hypothetical protein